MRRTDIVATKSNLLRLREHFGFVTAAHELLEQKREVLLEELIEIYREAGQARRDVEGRLRSAYAALRGALLTAGRPLAEAEALASDGGPRLRIRERSIMGVIVPLLDAEIAVAAAAAAPGWASAGAAQVHRSIRELLPLLLRLAEIEVSCRRLAAELLKTRRKVNALEHIFIPEYRDTIRFIEGALEEKEREALFQMKRLKERTRAERVDESHD